MALRIALGSSSFRALREAGGTYVDKSLLIRDLIDDHAAAILLPRPRRFGKTTNLSMLRSYFEKSREPLWPLFQDLAIAQAGEAYRAHFQRYPVIYLTFKDLKENRWSDCETAVAYLMADAYAEHRYLLDEGGLSPEQHRAFLEVLQRQARGPALSGALKDLSRWLWRHHGEKVVILLDEYDTPLHTAYLKDYYDDAVAFFRNLLSGALKDNDALYKGVLTGILRVAKDSIFTGLNNLAVATLVQREYAEHFGFTEPEVVELLRQGQCLDRLPEVQRWYNGYLFGDGLVIYNPWSVLSFLRSKDRGAMAYWAETSGNELIRELMVDRGLGLGPDMERLLRGESIEKLLIEQVALRELRERPELVWSFLLMSGYLKLVRRRQPAREVYGEMAIPNLEVQTIYETLFRTWWSQSLGGDDRRQALVKALLKGDEETCQIVLEDWLEESASSWDTARGRRPERFYHGFVLGLLVSLGEGYVVESNRETGLGRSDLMIAPKTAGQPGVVIELKVRRRNEDMQRAVEAAFRQLEDRRYAAALRARGADPVWEFAVAFDGKEVTCKRRPAP